MNREKLGLDPKICKVSTVKTQNESSLTSACLTHRSVITDKSNDLFRVRVGLRLQIANLKTCEPSNSRSACHHRGSLSCADQAVKSGGLYVCGRVAHGVAGRHPSALR